MVTFRDEATGWGITSVAEQAPPKFIQNQMGHASLVTTLDHYGHLMPSSYLEFGEKFDDFVLNE
jgi:integrase